MDPAVVMVTSQALRASSWAMWQLGAELERRPTSVQALLLDLIGA